MKINLFKSYLAMIRNSDGTNMFRNLYMEVNGETKDVLRNGDLSCAVFVSSILYLWKLIGDTHANVSSTIKDMERNGWKKIDMPREGCVIEWEKMFYEENGEEHQHIGFYVGDNEALSTQSKKDGSVHRHHWTFDADGSGRPNQKVVGMYWHEKLDEK